MFNFFSIKSLKEFFPMEQYQYAEGFPLSLYNCYVFTGSITAPAANKTYLQASETQRYYFCLFSLSTTNVTMQISLVRRFNKLTILGDPGAISRVGRKGRTKVFKYGRKSPFPRT